MDIERFTDKLKKGDYEDDIIFYILVTKDIDNDLVVQLDIDLIAKSNGLEPKIIDSLDEIPEESFIEDTNLYIIKTDKWQSDAKHKNTIVVCKSTNQKECVKIPELEDWQVVDYAITKVPGLSQQDLEWLIAKYCKNYLMFMNDIDKIACFNKGSQKIMFDELVRCGEFDSISNLNIFDLSNALVKKDIPKVREVMKVIKHIDITPMYLLTVLCNTFRNVTYAQLNPKCTAEDLGISDKQLWVIKKFNCGYYSNSQLIDIMSMLTNMEYMFKYEDLPMSLLMDYMIVKILGV